VDCTASGVLDLDTSLMFPIDDAVHAYFRGRDYEIDELDRARIGYIYLTVRFAPTLHPHFASLQFTAATSHMSRLFERSASVRAVFTELTAASGQRRSLRRARHRERRLPDLLAQRQTDPGNGPRPPVRKL